MKKIIFGSVLLVLVASFSAYAGGVVQVQCEDENAGVEVFINGKSAGVCPVDASAKPGTVLVSARKPVGTDQEMVFEKKFQLAEGAVEQVDLILSSPQLTAAARAKKDAAEVGALLTAASAGNVTAMRKLAQHYEDGAGVSKDASQAASWRNKAEATTTQKQLVAANAGDLDAMLYMAIRYDNGLGVDKDPAQAKAWREKAAAAKAGKH